MSTMQTITTAEQLLNATNIGRAELVKGELITMSPSGYRHGIIAGEIHGSLRAYLKERGLGRVLSAETGFVLERNPDTVRAPDVAMILSNNLRREQQSGFYDGVPDLAVEVLSPGDSAEEVDEKINDWLRAGCPLVWVVNPRTKSLTAHHTDRTARTYHEGEPVPGEPVLPGFTLDLCEVFEE